MLEFKPGINAYSEKKSVFHMLSLGELPIQFFFKILIIYLREKVREREHEPEQGRGRGGNRLQAEQGA